MMRKLIICMSMGLFLTLAVACAPGAGEPEATLTLPTPIFQGDDEQTSRDSASSAPLPPAPTFEVPAGIAGAISDSDSQSAEETSQEPQLYHVVFVESDDVLNLRSGPGVEFEVVQSMPPDATGIIVTGPGQIVISSTWVPISADGKEGWVNGRFLAETVSEEVFCRDERVQELLADFASAVAEQDDAMLSELIHPERGLRIGQSWWNPQILLREDAATDIFSSSTEFDWGIEDGSGLPITGTFSEIILPLLQDDLLMATESACNEIIHGGTAGSVRLPEGYNAINYYTFFRPGTEEFSELDWGSWVVGIERWQEAYYLSFLVHFAWEI